MNSRFIYALFWLIFAIWNYYDWRKNKDKDLIWFMGFSFLAFLIELIYFYLITINVSQNILSIIGSFNKIIDVFGGIIFIFILIKNFRSKIKS